VSLREKIEPHHMAAIERAISRLDVEVDQLRADRNYDVMFPEGDAKALREVIAILDAIPAAGGSSDAGKDAHIRELLKLTDELANRSLGWATVAVDNEVQLAAISEQLKAAEKDAVRYRWLRDNRNPGTCSFYLSVGVAFKGIDFTSEQVDWAVDAAIAKKAPAK
jgi:hypothetical protein